MQATKRTGVYLWKCLVSGKCYVGSASISFKDRKKSHLSDLRRGIHYNRYFQAAWNKYGEDTFEYWELEVCPPDQCIEREQYWLDLYQAADSRYGYNLSPTAGNCRGVIKSEEARAKHSVLMKKRYEDQEEREKTRLCTKEAYDDPGLRGKISQAVRAANERPGIVEKRAAAVKKSYEDFPLRKKKKAEEGLENWNKATEEEKKSRLSGLVACCTDPELKKKKTEAVRAAWENKTDEEKAAYAEKKRKDLSSPEVRKRISEGCKKGCAIPGQKERKSKATAEGWKDPESRAKRIEGLKRAAATNKKAAEKRVAGIKAAWADPEKRAKRLAAIKEGWARRRERLKEEKTKVPKDE
jgi:group I intron endonuclease